GRGAVPVRDEPAERQLVQRLRAELDLIPGRRATYAGADAARFAERLRRWRGDLAGEAAPAVGKPAALHPVLEVAAATTAPRPTCASRSASAPTAAPAAR